jgi:hypothetical protein
VATATGAGRALGVTTANGAGGGFGVTTATDAGRGLGVATAMFWTDVLGCVNQLKAIAKVR